MCCGMAWRDIQKCVDGCDQRGEKDERVGRREEKKNKESLDTETETKEEEHILLVSNINQWEFCISRVHCF